MTPEQDSKSEENCTLKPAKAGHSSNTCLITECSSIAQIHLQLRARARRFLSFEYFGTSFDIGLCTATEASNNDVVHPGLHVIHSRHLQHCNVVD